MKKSAGYRFDTRVIHEGQAPEDWKGATMAPIFQTASHRYESAEELSLVFGGKEEGHVYSRLTNPTNKVLEEKLAALEGGAGAVVMSSGMAAVSNTCMALLRAGDEFVSGSSLFMSTYTLFTSVFKKYGVTARLVDPCRYDAIEKAVNEKTRFIYVETIGNPKMDVPDLERIADIAHRNGLPLIVDNTVASPWLCRPIEWGADVVIHSTTKYLSGHGNAPGGVVIDGGAFDFNSDRFEDFKPFVERKGKLALLDRIWREHHINFGTSQAPFHSYLTMLGLDTLALRMRRHQENAAGVAEFLKARREVEWVNFPGLSGDPGHKTAEKLFRGEGFGAMLTFGLKDQESCFRFIDNLKLIYHLANVGDCKTLVIHPWSTQFVSFEDRMKRELSVTPGLLRLCVGIEDVEDIKNDLAQALDAI